MSHSATETRKLIEDYLRALSGRTKTSELVAQFVSDPALAEHIKQVEAAFPAYELIANKIVVEGDQIAMRGTFRGTHRGAFGGIAPTGNAMSAGLMIFYRLSNGRIAEHWLQMDNAGLMAQLTATASHNAGSQIAQAAA